MGGVVKKGKKIKSVINIFHSFFVLKLFFNNPKSQFNFINVMCILIN